MSSVSGVHPGASTAPVSANAAQAAQTSQVPQVPEEEVAAVYEKGTASGQNVTYKRDTVKVAEILSKERAYVDNLQNIVRQLISQTNNSKIASGSFDTLFGAIDPNRVESYWDLLIDNGNGTFSFHPDLSPDAQQALIDKAKFDISEEGYYGVKQTSQRIIDFSKAITGGDPSKIELMRESVKKAFEEVKDMLGGLPEVSVKTYEAVMKGFDEWAAESKSVAG